MPPRGHAGWGCEAGRIWCVGAADTLTRPAAHTSSHALVARAHPACGAVAVAAAAFACACACAASLRLDQVLNIVSLVFVSSECLLSVLAIITFYRFNRF